MPDRLNSRWSNQWLASGGAGTQPRARAPVHVLGHKPVFIAFLLVCLVNVAIVGFGIAVPKGGLWMEALLPASAMATTLVGLRRTLPWQNIAALTAIIGAFAIATMMVCVRTGLPFGPLVYLDSDSNPMFGTVPWWVPVLWVVLMVNARGVARLALFRWRATRNYGLWVIALTCLLVVGFDLGLEPVATLTRHYWVWVTGKSSVNWTWYGAPLGNFLAWIICTFLVVLATTVWSINKRPVPVVPNYHPLAVWGLLTAWLLAANAAESRWGASLVLMILQATVAAFCVGSRDQLDRPWSRDRQCALPARTVFGKAETRVEPRSPLNWSGHSD